MNAMDTMVESNSVVLYAGGAFLLAFVCSVLGKFNALEQRVSLVMLTVKYFFEYSEEPQIIL